MTSHMTPQQLAVLGQGRYGARWQVPLAEEAGVHRNTMGRWARGEIEIDRASAALLREIERSPVPERTVRYGRPRKAAAAQPAEDDSPSPVKRE